MAGIHIDGRQQVGRRSIDGYPGRSASLESGWQPQRLEFDQVRKVEPPQRWRSAGSGQKA